MSREGSLVILWRHDSPDAEREHSPVNEEHRSSVGENRGVEACRFGRGPTDVTVLRFFRVSLPDTEGDRARHVLNVLHDLQFWGLMRVR